MFLIYCIALKSLIKLVYVLSFGNCHCLHWQVSQLHFNGKANAFA